MKFVLGLTALLHGGALVAQSVAISDAVPGAVVARGG